MAGTDDDLTLEEWPLLLVVREFVARYTKSRQAAERLIIEHAQDGFFRQWQWHQRGKDASARGFDPRFLGTSGDGYENRIDWEASSLTYTRTEPNPLGSGRLVLHYLSEFLGPPYVRIDLIRLHRDDVIAMLRAVGLIDKSQESAPETPAAQPAESEPAKSDTASKTWVFDQMNRNRAKGVRESGSDLWERRPPSLKDITKKTFQNLVSDWRKLQRLQRRAKAPEKIPAKVPEKVPARPERVRKR